MFGTQCAFTAFHGNSLLFQQALIAWETQTITGTATKVSIYPMARSLQRTDIGIIAITREGFQPSNRDWGTDTQNRRGENVQDLSLVSRSDGNDKKRCEKEETSWSK